MSEIIFGDPSLHKVENWNVNDLIWIMNLPTVDQTYIQILEFVICLIWVTTNSKNNLQLTIIKNKYTNN